jgi:hypothetical protein
MASFLGLERSSEEGNATNRRSPVLAGRGFEVFALRRSSDANAHLARPGESWSS